MDKPADTSVSKSCPTDAAPKNLDAFRIYKNYCYLFNTKRMVYADAEKFCKKHKGTLAMPKEYAENSFYMDAIDELGIEDPLWIGISDRDTEGEFVYADGTEVTLKKFNFIVNPILVEVQDCVALEPSSSLWHRYRCTSTLVTSARRPFICQFDI